MKGLLSVSFGTSHIDTRQKTIDAIDADLAAAFPDRAFYSAWTSPRIMAKVAAERGEHHDSLEEAFARLEADGVDDLVVGTMCLMQGHEMAKITRATAAWAAGGERTVTLAAPLLADEAGIGAVARAVDDEFAWVPKDAVVVLMGHGSPKGPNQVYTQVQSQLDALQPGRFFVATVEGEPLFEDILPAIKAKGAKQAYLAPLMVVAGDHAKNDMAGDDDDSWASQLKAQGIQAEAVLKGLGEYTGVRALACDRARQAQPVAACKDGDKAE